MASTKEYTTITKVMETFAPLIHQMFETCGECGPRVFHIASPHYILQALCNMEIEIMALKWHVIS
jgi:hypothetical protein